MSSKNSSQKQSSSGKDIDDILKDNKQLKSQVNSLSVRINSLESTIKEDQKQMEDRIKELTSLKESEMQQMREHIQTKVGQIRSRENSVVEKNRLPNSREFTLKSSDDHFEMDLTTIEIYQRENEELKELLRLTRKRLELAEKKTAKYEEQPPLVTVNSIRLDNHKTPQKQKADSKLESPEIEIGMITEKRSGERKIVEGDFVCKHCFHTNQSPIVAKNEHNYYESTPIRLTKHTPDSDGTSGPIENIDTQDMIKEYTKLKVENETQADIIVKLEEMLEECKDEVSHLKSKLGESSKWVEQETKDLRMMLREKTIAERESRQELSKVRELLKFTYDRANQAEIKARILNRESKKRIITQSNQRTPKDRAVSHDNRKEDALAHSESSGWEEAKNKMIFEKVVKRNKDQSSLSKNPYRSSKSSHSIYDNEDDQASQLIYKHIMKSDVHKKEDMGVSGLQNMSKKPKMKMSLSKGSKQNRPEVNNRSIQTGSKSKEANKSLDISNIISDN